MTEEPNNKEEPQRDLTDQEKLEQQNPDKTMKEQTLTDDDLIDALSDVMGGRLV